MNTSRLLPRPARWCVILTLVSLLTPLIGVVPAQAATVPAGFAETRLASNLGGVYAIALAPDGRVFISIQGGKIRIVKSGALLSTPFLTLDVAGEGTQGLMGVTFDPNFDQNHWVYVFYTAKTPTVHNRVSRFTASGDVADPASEVVLLDLPTRAGKPITHDGGDLHFGPDGKLYVSVGDNSSPSAPQSKSTLFGKMLRMNRDGTAPTDNPFYSTTSGPSRLIWALGLRNPFKFNFQRGTGRMFINDVGNALYEEINEGAAGANYGWPVTEGPTSDPRFRGPVYAYPHSGGEVVGCAIAGGAFYNPQVQQFPSSFVGNYLFSDYCGGWIKRLSPATKTVQPFTSGSNSPIDLEVAPDGSVYHATRNDLFRITYTGSTTNSPPTITSHPADKTVSEGQPATFSVSAIGAAPLSYQWQRNGVDIAGATSSSYTLSPATAADNGSTFLARVSNPYGSTKSSAAVLTVVKASGAPTATITLPAQGATYKAGDTIDYAGTASDPEDGSLPASAFTWRVDFHHDTHTHPFIPATTGSQSGSFVVPTEGETSANVWYRIHLTVRDSGGLQSATFRDVRPLVSTVQVASEPSGLQVALDGQPRAAPYSFSGVVGMKRTLEALSPQSLNGSTWEFSSWSDGGSRAHAIATPDSITTYTATFVQGGGGGGGGTVGGSALFVVGDPTLAPSDEAVSDRLEALGYQVSVLDDDLATAGHATGKDLVVISSSVTGVVGGKFRDVNVPVLLWEAWLYDDMGMAPGNTTGRGTIGSQTDVAISDPAHPLAAGLTGTPAVASTRQWFSWANPNAHAARVATVPGDATKALVFGYEAGASLQWLAAPARRVGFFLGEGSATNLTTNGWALFDAAVRWANPGGSP